MWDDYIIDMPLYFPPPEPDRWRTFMLNNWIALAEDFAMTFPEYLNSQKLCFVEITEKNSMGGDFAKAEHLDAIVLLENGEKLLVQIDDGHTTGEKLDGLIKWQKLFGDTYYAARAWRDKLGWHIQKI